MAFQNPGPQHQYRENLSSYQPEILSETQDNLAGCAGEPVHAVEVELDEPVDDELRPYGDLWNYLLYVSSCFEEGKILKDENRKGTSNSNNIDKKEIDIEDESSSPVPHENSISKSSSYSENKEDCHRDLTREEHSVASRSAMNQNENNTDASCQSQSVFEVVTLASIMSSKGQYICRQV